MKNHTISPIVPLSGFAPSRDTSLSLRVLDQPKQLPRLGPPSSHLLKTDTVSLGVEEHADITGLGAQVGLGEKDLAPGSADSV